MIFKINLFLCSCLLLSSCFKRIVDVEKTESQKGPPKSKLEISLKNIVIDKDFNFSLSKEVKIHILTNDLVKVDIYEIQKMRNEK